MKVQLLKNPDIYPSSDVLRDALGDCVDGIFNVFIKTVTNDDYGLISEWRYYNDGKAWLCKYSYKKKTVFWLSVWEECFKISFFFTEKHRTGLAVLDVAQEIKDNFALTQPTGRLIPLIFDVTDQKQIEDVLTVIRFKKSIK